MGPAPTASASRGGEGGEGCPGRRVSFPSGRGPGRGPEKVHKPNRETQEDGSVSDRKLGFIGLGAMGSGMVKSLMRAAFPVTVYDVREEARAALVTLGATEARSPHGAASGADLVLSSLPEIGRASCRERV